MAPAMDNVGKPNPEDRDRSSWRALRARLRRWWHEDRIRVSYGDFADDALRVGDRLQIDRNELRLVRHLDSRIRFEARDPHNRPWTVERQGEVFRLTAPDGRALRLSAQTVLVVPVSRRGG